MHEPRLLLTLVVDAVCAAFFRTKARHLNASDSRTNGINLMLDDVRTDK